MANTGIILQKLVNTHTGVEVERWVGNHVQNAEAFKPRRHDHYTCLLLETGKIDIMLDFQSVTVKPGMLFISYPGQVHQVISSLGGAGWYVSFESRLIDEPIRSTLDESVTEVLAVLLSQTEDTWFKKSIGLMLQLEELNKGADHNRIVTHALLKAFVYEAMIIYRKTQNHLAERRGQRQFIVAKEFKKILRNHYKNLKKPADYADQLNISVNYLNACVKAVTANSVSALIHREVIAESQRLLFYTDLDIKEIALDLGFEDQKYFSRLFKKVVGVGPTAFRDKQLSID
ncbi:AraC family transcriptional regulator [Dyadobacter fermentans]|uniref:AraC family transcriptional regulator n=1 Tax=Dyadobacter fermentans TaxID=94254 RepID=UPI001CBF91BD|nr:AraC family transcriptional regulator [Dyadobacter fermentans]MBZ1360422.1 AraC family transcriptional regulator [Dyadobacter fermentans]